MNRMITESHPSPTKFIKIKNNKIQVNVAVELDFMDRITLLFVPVLTIGILLFTEFDAGLCYHELNLTKLQKSNK